MGTISKNDKVYILINNNHNDIIKFYYFIHFNPVDNIENIENIKNIDNIDNIKNIKKNENIENIKKISDENILYNNIFTLCKTIKNKNRFQLFTFDKSFKLIELSLDYILEHKLHIHLPQLKEIFYSCKGLLSPIRPIYIKTKNKILEKIYLHPLNLCNDEQLIQLQKLSKLIIDSGQLYNFNLDFNLYKFAITYENIIIGYIEVLSGDILENAIQCYIIPNFRKNGIASFAIKEVISYLNYEQYYSCVLPNNIAYINLITKLLFTKTEKNKKINGLKYDIYHINNVKHDDSIIEKLYENNTINNDIKSGVYDIKSSVYDFPYRRHYMPKFEIMYSELKNIKKNINYLDSITDSKYIYTLDRTFPDEYEQVDSISDHFVEEIRIQCAERGYQSPLEIWKKNKQSYLEQINLEQTTSEQTKLLRELVYNDARGCNLFNVALGVHLFSYFKATRLLDCTAGWGDRLIAAAVAGVKFYRGWDTNEKLQPVYNNIYNKICEIENTSIMNFQMDYRIFCAPFEKTKLFNHDEFNEQNYYNQFDVAFLSPPFYDKELYEGDITSTTSYKNINDWYKYFYRPMFKRAALAVCSGGHILGYVPDGRMRKEANSVLEENGFKYLGIFAFRTIVEGKSPQIRDTFIWQSMQSKKHTTKYITNHLDSNSDPNLNNLLPYKNISSMSFKLGQKLSTNKNELISTEEKFNKLLSDNPDLKIMEIPQNVKKTIEINILIYTIIKNKYKIVKYYLTDNHDILIDKLEKNIKYKIDSIIKQYGDNSIKLVNDKMAMVRCIFSIDIDDVLWITSISENAEYKCPIHEKIIFNQIIPYHINYSHKGICISSQFEYIKIKPINKNEFIIYKSDKSIGAINIEKNIYGFEISILLKPKYKKKEIIFMLFIILSEYSEYEYSDELTYIEIPSSDIEYISICNKLKFKNITTFGHNNSIVYKI